MMTDSAPRQLTLDLPHLPAFEAEDFFVSGSNKAAVDLVASYPDWPHWGAVVCGPPGSGKTHLAHVWQFQSGAPVVAIGDIDDGLVGTFRQTGAIAIEDLHEGVEDQRLLFHLLNVARQDRLHILLTSRIAPGELDIPLPDLSSRLKSLPISRIDAPDEMLLRAVLVKLFTDRQLRVEPRVINYLMLRMERSMAAAEATVAAIDQLALAMQRRVTIPLAQRALDLVGSET